MEFKIVKTLGYLVNRCGIVMRSELQKRFNAAKIKITPEEWVILGVLWNHDGLSINEVASRTLKDRTTVTRFLDRLEEKKLIKRTASSKDKRTINVLLTKRGNAVKSKLVPIAETFLNECASVLTREELEVTLGALNKIIEKFKS